MEEGKPVVMFAEHTAVGASYMAAMTLRLSFEQQQHHQEAS